MKAVKKHFPAHEVDEITRALKGYRGADLVRRIRYVRTGKFMIRIHNEQGGIIARGPFIKTESESIRIYNEIVNGVGKDLPQLIKPKDGDEFFAALDSEEDEEDFLDAFSDGDTDDDAEGEDDFLSGFDEASDEDFFSSFDDEE